MTTNDDAQRGYDPVCGCGHFASEHHFDRILGCNFSADGISFCACTSAECDVYRAELVRLAAQVTELETFIAARAEDYATRITELQAANTREVERRREVEGWIPVSERRPTSGQRVIVSGGAALYRNGIWYSLMDDVIEPLKAPIQWSVLYWKPFDLAPNDRPCDRDCNKEER